MKIGDKVKAIEGTTSAIWAEGRIGTIAELHYHAPYSWNDSKNLIRWGDETILMGFDPKDVEPVNG